MLLWIREAVRWPLDLISRGRGAGTLSPAWGSAQLSVVRARLPFIQLGLAHLVMSLDTV